MCDVPPDSIRPVTTHPPQHYRLVLSLSTVCAIKIIESLRLLYILPCPGAHKTLQPEMR